MDGLMTIAHQPSFPSEATLHARLVCPGVKKEKAAAAVAGHVEQ
jgi:hypothetical protein